MTAALVIGLVACGEPEHAPELAGPDNLVPSASTEPLTVKKLVYVPIYSSLYVSERARPIDMLANLSLRNMSETVPVVVSRVDDFDSHGKLIRSHPFVTEGHLVSQTPAPELHVRP